MTQTAAKPRRSRKAAPVEFATRLDAECATGSQSQHYTGIYKVMATGQKLRIRIKADSYDIQSYAVVELHKDAEWKPLASIHYSRMAAKGLGYARTEFVAAALRDVCELLRLAELILAA